MSAPVSTASHIRATLVASETDLPKIAAASQASTNCLKPSQILNIRIMPARRSGPTTTILTPSTTYRSNMPLAALQIAVTQLAHALPRKSRSARPHDPRSSPDGYDRPAPALVAMERRDRTTLDHAGDRPPMEVIELERLTLGLASTLMSAGIKPARAVSLWIRTRT